MNFWPLQPGFTAITITWSSSGSSGSRTVTGGPGLMQGPASLPPPPTSRPASPGPPQPPPRPLEGALPLPRGGAARRVPRLDGGAQVDLQHVLIEGGREAAVLVQGQLRPRLPLHLGVTHQLRHRQVGVAEGHALSHQAVPDVRPPV